MPRPRACFAQRGLDVWVVGGPGEKALAAEIVAAGGPGVRDLTGTDLRNGILAMAAAGVAISNDSGLMHIAAAIGTPTMGIFGPTSPYLWAPLNGLAATVQTKTPPPCEPCQRTDLHHERPCLHARPFRPPTWSPSRSGCWPRRERALRINIAAAIALARSGAVITTDAIRNIDGAS